MSEARQHDWMEDRIADLRHDPEYLAKVQRIREGVADGSYKGQVTTRSDIESLIKDL